MLYVRSRLITVLLLGLGACQDPSAEDEPAIALATLGSAPPDMHGASATTFDHGTLSFGTPLPITLDRARPRHIAHFTLSGPARVALRTQAAEGGAQVDTLLTLYREARKQPWAQNDDAEGSRFSRLDRVLGAGSYAVRVQGLARATPTDCELLGTCAGSGCPEPPAPACLFGDTFYALRTDAKLTVLDEHWVRSSEQLRTQTEAGQLVIAVQQSSHSDVRSADEALAAVDQGEARRMRLRDEQSGREYDVFEYGAGDNSYGAIFAADSLEKLASIHDGDIIACTE